MEGVAEHRMVFIEYSNYITVKSILNVLIETFLQIQQPILTSLMAVRKNIQHYEYVRETPFNDNL